MGAPDARVGEAVPARCGCRPTWVRAAGDPCSRWVPKLISVRLQGGALAGQIEGVVSSPLVTGVALPALYIPLILMLFSLIARGVAIVLIEQHDGWHPVWGRLFGIGSLVAGFCQGAAFGGLVAGFNVRGDAFVGGPFTFLHNGYAIVTGLTAVALYVLAGSAQVYLKTSGEMERRAARSGRIATIALALGTVASWVLAPVAGPLTLHLGETARLPIWIIGALVLAAGLAVAFRSFASDREGGRSDSRPWIATLAVYGGGLLVAGGLLYPTLVPPSVTVHEAASPHTTLLFMTIAMAVFLPIILTYQVYGYRVFHGKVNANQEATA